jgi:hypothetical protein
MNAKPYILIAAALLTGCANRGVYFDWEDANRIKNGMSREQVIAIMGDDPSSENGDGSQLSWSFIHANGLTGSYYTKAVRFSFDKYGKVYDVPPEGVAPYLKD